MRGTKIFDLAGYATRTLLTMTDKDKLKEAVKALKEVETYLIEIGHHHTIIAAKVQAALKKATS